MESKVLALKIKQNDRDILMFSISAKDLKDICYFNEREIDREKGIQRGFQSQRSREIAKYIDSEGAVLANNIIINFELKGLGLNLSDIYDEKNKLLNIKLMKDKKDEQKNVPPELKGKVAFVIDGQHRIRAFKYAEKKDFPLVVAALINRSLAEIAEIFVKINYYQKPVNKSLVFDLLGISENIFPKYYILHNLIKKLADVDVASPFYGRVKMLGVGPGFISQAALITAIEDYKIEQTLEESGVKATMDNLYNTIWHFFDAVAKVFGTYWEKKTFLSRTIGTRALFKVMKDILYEFAEKGLEFSSAGICEYLSVIDTEFLEDPDLSGLSGEKGVHMLYERIMRNTRGGNGD